MSPDARPVCVGWRTRRLGNFLSDFQEPGEPPPSYVIKAAYPAHRYGRSGHRTYVVSPVGTETWASRSSEPRNPPYSRSLPERCLHRPLKISGPGLKGADIHKAHREGQGAPSRL